jgi:hypothetical protein
MSAQVRLRRRIFQGMGHQQAIMDYYRAKMEGPEKH